MNLVKQHDTQQDDHSLLLVRVHEWTADSGKENTVPREVLG